MLQSIFNVANMSFNAIREIKKYILILQYAIVVLDVDMSATYERVQSAITVLLPLNSS